MSHYVDAASIPSDGKVRVLLGSYGELRSPVPYPQPVTYLNVKLADGERWTYRPHPTHEVAWLAVSLGTLRAAGARVSREMVIFWAKERTRTPSSRILPEGIADAVAYVVTPDRRVAVNETLVRAGTQTWLTPSRPPRERGGLGERWYRPPR